MKNKLIALDLDDTLLNSSHQLSQVNQNIINKILNLGANITLASGRPHHSLSIYAELLKINLPLISANGSLIKDENETYKKININYETAKAIVNYGKKNGYIISIYFEDKIITNNSESEKIHRELKEVDDIIMNNDLKFLEEPIKILLNIDKDSANEKMIKDGFKELRKNYDQKLYLTSASRNSIEVMNKNATKGNGLKYIADKLNITPENIVAIGNGHNDIKMFEVAGLSIAMGNSSDYVKSKADYVTKNHDQDGVAYAIKKYILGEEQI